MSEEELEDLLDIGCCNYHIEIGKKAKKEIESLQQEIKELNDSVIWWTNRFNALQRDYENWKWQKELLIKRDKEHQEEIERLCNTLNEIIERNSKAIEYITNQKLHKFEDTTGGLTYEERKLLEILGSDKE